MARPTPCTCGHDKWFSVRNSVMEEIQLAMTASRPFAEFVERWSNLVVTASPFSHTAAVLHVVPPLSVPMKIFLELMNRQTLRRPTHKGKDYSWRYSAMA